MEKNNDLPQMPHANKENVESKNVSETENKQGSATDPRQEAIENETDTRRLRSEQQSTKEGGEDA